MPLLGEWVGLGENGQAGDFQYLLLLLLVNAHLTYHLDAIGQLHHLGYPFLDLLLYVLVNSFNGVYLLGLVFQETLSRLTDLVQFIFRQMGDYLRYVLQG